MEFLPIFLDVKARRCVVIGDGADAARRAELLLAAGAAVTIVAPHPDAALARLLAAGRCRHRREAFRPEHLDGALLAMAASGDEALDREIADAASARSLPVNVHDRPALSSFIMPAIVDRAPVIVAVSTGGASPVLAQLLRARIEQALPAGLGALAERARALRERVRRRLPSPAARRAFWRRALTGRLAALVRADRPTDARDRRVGARDRAASPPGDAAAPPRSRAA
jgi:uroporphyrin-III C-methyltransferase/precorrin-2 dehydrogenase/sirohydrochlorin ferrochelatase